MVVSLSVMLFIQKLRCRQSTFDADKDRTCPKNNVFTDMGETNSIEIIKDIISSEFI